MTRRQLCKAFAGAWMAGACNTADTVSPGARAMPPAAAFAACLGRQEGAPAGFALRGAYFDGICTRLAAGLAALPETPLRRRIGRVPHRYDRIALR